MHPRVLIVGTVPYNRQSTSRAFDSYFHFWEKENLRQIFSNTKTPCKGHCEKLYQITDVRMLRRRFDKSIETGKEFEYADLPDEWKDGDLEVNSKTVSKLYSLGSRKSSFVYLLRKLIWKKKYWHTKKLDRWLDSFQPECVFLSFSDDFFIPEIALYVAEKYDIPIVSSIGDDYYFNYNFSLSPLYHLYKRSYRKLIRRVLSHKGSAIYIGNKIRDKYNGEFSLDGKTVYLTSEVERRPFAPINTKEPKIAYFGNVRLGRNESLCMIADALLEINPDYRISVYSNESDEKYYKMLSDHPGIDFCGRIPYSEVVKKMAECDIQIVPEGFKKKDVDISRYSLSTKVADSLASGSAVLAFGSEECGAIEYAQSTGCITTCTKKEQLYDALKGLIFDEELQRVNYEKSIALTAENHTIENSTKIFEGVVRRATEGK